MQNKKNRVLWLLNHETLRNFEVPLIRSLGFEVYLPKRFPKTEEYGSGSVDDSYDATLTIPKDVLEMLNRHDFYSDPVSLKLAEEMNRYFSTVIFGCFPKMFEQMVHCFSGKMFLRVFGREQPRNYGELVSYGMYRKIYRFQHRFFLAQAYPFLAEVESGIFKDKAVTLPLGIPDVLLQEGGSWKGGNQKLLFVCPRITQSPYYKMIYDEFKKHFGDIPHLIAGKQFFKLDDPAVQGCLKRDEYNELLRSSDVMFYHSVEPRHLHYHPLEAVVFGLPLIFMQGGVLGRLAPSKLPGACDSYSEAKEKIRAIMDGDRAFREKVIDSQKVLLEPFAETACQKAWEENFIPILQQDYPGDVKFSPKPFLKYVRKKICKLLS